VTVSDFLHLAGVLQLLRSRLAGGFRFEIVFVTLSSVTILGHGRSF
jgi:hypothetical protein